MVMKPLILILFMLTIGCVVKKEAHAQMKPEGRPVPSPKQLIVDSVNLFTSKTGALGIQNFRQVGPIYLQITNFAGKSLQIKMSLDRKTWVSTILKSPEKKVFTCPEGVNQLYLIIDPDNPYAVKTVIKRNAKYELFYNKSTELYDIMRIE